MRTDKSNKKPPENIGEKKVKEDNPAPDKLVSNIERLIAQNNQFLGKIFASDDDKKEIHVPKKYKCNVTLRDKDGLIESFTIEEVVIPLGRS